MGYAIEKGKAVHYAEPTCPGQAARTLEDADVNTFVILNKFWAKDRERVWARNRPVPGAYAPAFQALNAAFGRDNECVFDSYGRPLKGVNAAAFEVLDDALQGRFAVTGEVESYARCEGKIYHYASQDHKAMWLRGADAPTFRALKWGYGCDARRVYSGNLLVKGVHAESFRQLTPCYSTDGQSVFYFAQTVVRADPATFEPFGSEFWKDADAGDETTRCRNEMWAKDRNHVYYQYQVMEGLDPATAMVVGGMLKDGQHVYAGYDRPVEGADAPTFEPVPGSYSYYRDRWRVYSCSTPLEGADPATFEALPPRHPSKGDAWDVNWIYQNERRWKPRSEFSG